MFLVYTDFRTASFRNLIVCKELLSILSTCESKNKQQILHKIYYLSGYIIEFCYKFALFSGLNISKFENISDFGEKEFKEKWKHHSFSKLKNICIESKVIFSADIPYLGNNNIDKKVKYLIESWEVQIRYSLKLSKHPIANLSQNDIINLVELCEEILNKITTKYS